MKIEFWVVGKTQQEYLRKGIQIYRKRIGYYLKFDYKVIPDLRNTKNLQPAQIKEKEGQAILRILEPGTHLILLDEGGKSMDSMAFSGYINGLLNHTYRKIVFLVGGAYGFSEEIISRANTKLSLSKMTFSHQMVRLFFLEQLYRAMSILRNEPYHHQ